MIVVKTLRYLQNASGKIKISAQRSWISTDPSYSGQLLCASSHQVTEQSTVFMSIDDFTAREKISKLCYVQDFPESPGQFHKNTNYNAFYFNPQNFG